MKFASNILLGVCAYAAVAAAAFAQGDVLKSVEEARNFSDSALKQYNLTSQKLDEAGKILNENQNRLALLSGELFSLNIRTNSNDTDIKAKLNSLSVLKEDFADARNSLNSVKSGLEFASSILPLGKERIALGEKLYSECSDLVAKNPGENYADKNYFDFTASEFVRAKNLFLELQTELTQELSSVGIAGPRIKGIENFLELGDSYLEQASEKCRTNTDSELSMESELKKLIDSSIASISSLNKQYVELRSLKNSYVRSRLGLEAFVMNKLPKMEGGKYFDCVFKPSISLLVQSQILTKKAITKSPDMCYSFPQGLSETFASKGKAKNESLYSSAAALGGTLGFQREKVDDKKSIRDEILQRCTKLSYLTAELRGCSNMLSNLLNEVHASLNSISVIESESQAGLRGAIQAAADSQSIASEIEILKSKVEIAKAQSDVAAKRFEVLVDEAAQAKEKSLEDIKSLDKLVEELNKLE